MTQSFSRLCDYNEGDLVEPSGNLDDLRHIVDIFPQSFNLVMGRKSRFRVDKLTRDAEGYSYAYVTLLDEEFRPVFRSIGGFYVHRFRKCPCVVTSTRRLTVRCQGSEGS